MIQLTYISSAARGVTRDDVARILKSSRSNNAAAGITGLLLYDGRRFLQTLEGEPALVNETYMRIKADPRHRAVVLLSSNDLAARAFGRWAMAAEEIGAEDKAEELSRQVEALTADVADPGIRAHFRSFAAVRKAA